jgi:hypothetical protein
MTDGSAPISQTTPSSATAFSVKAAARSYGISADRSFFPVNSLRILYFLIVDFYTGGDVASREKIELLIPRVEAVLAARSKHRAENKEATLESDFAAAARPLQEIYQVIDTPTVRRAFEQYFSYLFPLQDSVFVGLFQRITNDDKLTSADLLELLKVRAMDSILFSTLISEIIKSKLGDSGKETDLLGLPLSLDYHLNLAYQLNDLVDSIAFAKNDLDTGNFSPFQVIRKVAAEAASAKEMIKETLSLLDKQDYLFTFPSPLQSQCDVFFKELINVVNAQ